MEQLNSQKPFTKLSKNEFQGKLDKNDTEDLNFSFSRGKGVFNT